LRTFSDRLGRISDQPRAPKWEKRAQLLYGATGAGVLGAIPFFAEKPSQMAEVVFGILVVVAALGGWLCARSADDVRAERVEQISAIKDDLDKYIISTFERPEDAASRRLNQ